MALDVNTALTTVEDVRLALGLSSPLTSDQTAQIEKAIKAASAAAVTFIGRGPLGFEEGIVEAVKGYGTSVRLVVSRIPIFAVSEVLLPTEDEVASADYVVEANGKTGIIALKASSGLSWATGVSFGAGVPFTGIAGPGIEYGPQVDSEIAAADLIKVTYDGGWALPGQTGLPSGVVPLPADIQAAIDAAAANAFQKIGRNLDIQSERLLSEQTTYVDRKSLVGAGSLAGWPVEAAEALKPYQRIAQF